MSRKRTKLGYKSLCVSFTISVVIVAFGNYFIDSITFNVIVSRIIWPLTRLMMFIGIGLFVGQVIEAAGWTRFLAFLAKPIFKFSKLQEQCSAAFTAAFISGVAGTAMLVEFYKEGKISKRSLFITNLLNQFPAYFLHLPTTLMIIIPLTGKAGVIYFLLTLLAVILRTILLLIYGRLSSHLESNVRPVIPGNNLQKESRSEKNKSKKPKGIIESIKKKLPGRIIRIAVYVLPIYTLVFVVHSAGFFDIIRECLAQFVVTTFIPMESLSLVILSFTAEFTSGFAAAGALLSQGILSIKQTVLALIIGNIIAFPLRALRHQLPVYLGLFSAKMGAQLIFLGHGYRILSLILVANIYYFL